MKLNIANPESGTQKTFELTDDQAVQRLVDKRVAQEFDGGILGDNYEGYVFRITGGCDKQGFPMKQGVLVNSRVKLLLSRGVIGYQAWRGRGGERNRKSVRGCIVGSDISVLNLVVVKKGEKEIEGVTDAQNPRRLGPKRAAHIRKLFDLSKEDDVRKYVIARTYTNKKGVSCTKRPKIQRLVTPLVLQRKRARRAAKMNSVLRNKEEAAAYKKVVAQRLAEQREARRSLISKRRSTRRSAKLAAEAAS